MIHIFTTNSISMYMCLCICMDLCWKYSYWIGADNPGHLQTTIVLNKLMSCAASDEAYVS